ncbi:hypothetical protein Rumeso_01574 [Rubellimicrobium mesophilum DSM 19309]|uniref:Uncharacterized protein n=1 Tax=Rubellimicrobium mesophilum DSM 19309 TaxID=442562 RepID=A0A017HQH4_9RHOB|nr:hypothetical protein Rumeso_01574 [Rubellimicrobium mesophilum DSM 19309]
MPAGAAKELGPGGRPPLGDVGDPLSDRTAEPLEKVRQAGAIEERHGQERAGLSVRRQDDAGGGELQKREGQILDRVPDADRRVGGALPAIAQALTLPEEGLGCQAIDGKTLPPPSGRDLRLGVAGRGGLRLQAPCQALGIGDEGGEGGGDGRRGLLRVGRDWAPDQDLAPGVGKAAVGGGPTHQLPSDLQDRAAPGPVQEVGGGQEKGDGQEERPHGHQDGLQPRHARSGREHEGRDRGDQDRHRQRPKQPCRRLRHVRDRRTTAEVGGLAGANGARGTGQGHGVGSSRGMPTQETSRKLTKR